MKKYKIYNNRFDIRVVALLCVLVFGSVVESAQADEFSWDKTIERIAASGDQDNKRNLSCIVELVFKNKGESGRQLQDNVINFSFVFPNASPDPIASINMVEGSTSEEKEVLKIIDDLHSTIVAFFGLNSAQCPYCAWPLVLPKVATTREKYGDLLVFSKSIKLKDSVFDGKAKSTMAFDEDSLDVVWSD
jgi:hypothetical protein